MTLPLLLAVLTNAVQLSDALQRNAVGETFDLRGTVVSDVFTIDRDFALADDSGAVIVLPVSDDSRPRIGSLIHIRGIIENAPFGHVIARSGQLEVLRTGDAPAVRTVTFAEVHSGRHDARVIRTTGMLRDYFFDEIDPKYLFLILNSDGTTLYAATILRANESIGRLDALLGHEVSITGLCDPHPSGCRRKIGRLIRLNGLSNLKANGTEPADPFDIPLFNSVSHAQPAELPALGRQRQTGHVIAVWQNRAFLLKTPDGRVSRIDLAKSPPPAYGDCVEILGFPETDLYRINFTRAIWRPAKSSAPLDAQTAQDIPAKALMTGANGGAAINADFHGRPVRLRGTVRSLPSVGNDGRFYLESDGYTLPVDISANPALAEKLEIGSVIDLTGVCVMDIENWRPNLVFPHIKEVMIVTRTPDDIVVIKRPPWWTPARLSIVIGSLFAVLIGILIWNRALKALAEKRGKALANEELERLESDLKVCERTRLAVELHDSIAQNLTGVSMEIDTALRGDEPLPESAAQHMGRALRTIDSCRGELRNCLWDLRSQALEEENMNKAIRLTLSQTIGKANLTVRFNVPRSRFTDNTAHTLLRIIRELASNAVRHGHATEIKVAGSIENDVLKFSVRDNGCGFDPDACPGVLDGHFGLQGVRERVASFEGNIRIESAPGKGTRVSVSINAPQAEDKEKL